MTGITDQQREVLQYVFIGKSDAEIGQIMGLSVYSVAHTIEKLRDRLGAFNRAYLVYRSLQVGILTPPPVDLLAAADFTYTPPLVVGGVVLDFNRRELRYNSKGVHLGKRSFALLALLLRRAGTVVTREELYAVGWQNRSIVRYGSLESLLHRLRARLHPPCPFRIEAVFKQGFRLELAGVVANAAGNTNVEIL